MSQNEALTPPPMPNVSHITPYCLDNQIGFILCQANQRYAVLFANGIGSGLIPTQWATLAHLGETGPCPQNQLGRFTAMNAATIKGVVEHLDKRGLIQRSTDPDDDRRLLANLNPAGRAELEADLATVHEIGRQALAPLSPQGQEILRGLLTCLI